jgi:hypothetical protein
MSIVIPSFLGVSNAKYPYFIRVFWNIVLDKIGLKWAYK